MVDHHCLFCTSRNDFTSKTKWSYNASSFAVVGWFCLRFLRLIYKTCCTCCYSTEMRFSSTRCEIRSRSSSLNSLYLRLIRFDQTFKILALFRHIKYAYKISLIYLDIIIIMMHSICIAAFTSDGQSSILISHYYFIFHFKYICFVCNQCYLSF